MAETILKAEAISNTAAGGIAATDAQAAINELDTEKQAVDATLTSLAALGTAADKYAYTTGVDTWAEGAITAAGRAILDDADAAAQRTTLGKDNHFYTATVTPASDANVTLTAAQYKLDRLKLVDGSWTTGHQIIVPNEVRRYYIDNTAGTYTATIITAAGTGIDVLPGTSRIVVCNGTNVLEPDSHYNSLLAEYIVTGSAVTSIDFTGLDINTHKSYRIEIDHADGATSSHNISMYVNADTTGTNYYNQVLAANGATVSGVRNNSANISSIVSGSRSKSVIVLQADDYANAVSIVTRSIGSIVESIHYNWSKTASVSNITQITLTASVASGFGVGSVVRIYRGDI